MEPPAMPTSRRARKKELLRAALIETAQRHFCEKGYGATTLAEICRENDVHVRTLLRYFGTKEALALAPARDGLGRLETMLEEHPADVPAIWERYVRSFWLDLDPDPGRALRYLRVLQEEPVLRSHLSELQNGFVDVLAVAISRADREDPSNDPYARFLASNLVLGSRNAALNIQSGGDLTIFLDTLLIAIRTILRIFPSRATFAHAWRDAERISHR